MSKEGVVISTLEYSLACIFAGKNVSHIDSVRAAALENSRRSYGGQPYTRWAEKCCEFHATAQDVFVACLRMTLKSSVDSWVAELYVGVTIVLHTVLVSNIFKLDSYPTHIRAYPGVDGCIAAKLERKTLVCGSHGWICKWNQITGIAVRDMLCDSQLNYWSASFELIE